MRKFIRSILVVSFLLSIALIIYVIADSKIDTSKLGVISGALAVIASIFSVYSSQRTLEIVEDSERPNLDIQLDSTKRYGLMLLVLKNVGKSMAYKINIEWNKHLKGMNTEKIDFKYNDGNMAISPGQSLVMTVNVHHEFISDNKDDDYGGTIYYKDLKNNEYREKFILNAKQFEYTSSIEDESTKAFYEIQKIPKALDKINKTIDVGFEKIKRENETKFKVKEDDKS